MKNIMTFALFAFFALCLSCKDTDAKPTSIENSEFYATAQDTVKNKKAGINANSNGSVSVGGAANDATPARNATDDYKGASATGRTGSTAVNRAKQVGYSKGTTEKDKTKSDYSAPDGTNAENHDGDMYTKNDKTPMPSGPPIK